MKKRRVDLGLTQREVARQIGANPWTVANWEKGNNHPAVWFLPAILRFLEYDPLPAGETWAEKIRAARVKLGLSQRTLAALLEADPSTVWKWESGSKKPSRRYCKTLDQIMWR
jgi:DNA-binding transcriptional regulator YiaG